MKYQSKSSIRVLSSEEIRCVSGGPIYIPIGVALAIVGGAIAAGYTAGVKLAETHNANDAASNHSCPAAQ